METRKFDFENGLELRVSSQLENEMSWFIAADICEIVGISDTSQAVERLDEDEKRKDKIISGGQTRELWLVNEFGLYQLILFSEKEEAKKFKRWITHDVLPTIRKSGKYSEKEIQDRDNTIKDLLEENKKLVKRNNDIFSEKKTNEKKIKENDDLIKQLLTTDFRQMKIDFNRTEQVEK